MSELKEKPEKSEAPTPGGNEPGPEMIRRDFIKRFGGYAAGTCAGLFVLMSTDTSTALGGSDGGPSRPRR